MLCSDDKELIGCIIYLRLLLKINVALDVRGEEAKWPV